MDDSPSAPEVPEADSASGPEDTTRWQLESLLDLVETTTRGPPDRVGVRIGRYVVLEEIGSGAMGRVLRAYDPKLQREVALKEMLVGSFGAEQTRDLVTEARAMARLSHPNVVGVYDVEELEDDRYALVMEYVSGSTLKGWLETPRSTEETVAMFVQAGRGLSAAHAAGITHGDFKLTNAIVDGNGRARVLDFGLAQPIAPPSSEEVTSDQAVPFVRGTPAYMAPEIIREGAAETRSDQFSFCVALWEGLAGERPFAGSSVRELAVAIVAGKTRPLPKSAHVPKWLHAALRRGLSRDPNDRWPSMDALIDELSRPRRGLRRTLVGVGTIGIVVAAWSVGASRTTLGSDCERRVDAQMAYWTPQRADSIRTAIESTKMAYAPRAAQTVDARLSDYASRWRAAWVEVCATPESARAPPQRKAAQLCLEHRRRRFDALGSALLQVSADDAARAADAVDRLPPLTACTDDLRLNAAALGEPEDLESRRRVEEIGRLVSSAWAASDLARYRSAALIAGEALEKATETGFAPIRFEALLALGASELNLEQHEAADGHLRDAYRVATQLGDPHRQMSATLVLAMLHGVRAGDLDRGREWLFHGRALLQRPELDDSQRARFHEVASALDQTDRRIDDAIGSLVRSRDIERRIHSEDSAVMANSGLRLSHLLRQTGRVQDALDLQAHAASVLQRLYGDDHPQVAEVANAQALSHLTAARLPEAKASFETALRIWRRTLPQDHPSIAFALTNLCRVYADLGDLEAALRFCEDAVALRDSGLPAGHPILAYTRSDRADILRRLGRTEDALAEVLAAIAVLERELGPAHPNLGDALTVLGRTLVDLGRPTEAIAPLRRALAARQSARYDHVTGETTSTRAALAMALVAIRHDDPEARLLAAQAMEAFATLPMAPTSILARDEAALRRALREDG